MATQGPSHSTWNKPSKPVPGSIKPVYGAQHPPLLNKPKPSVGAPSQAMSRGKGGRNDAFAEFAHKTSDAWDDGEDDIMISMGSMQVPLKEIKTTAAEVLNNHRLQLAAASRTQPQEEQAPPVREPVPRASLTDVQRQLEMASSSPNAQPNARPLPEHPPGRLVRLNRRGGPRSHRVPPNPQTAARNKERLAKFKSVLETPATDLGELRNLAWSGVAQDIRPLAWKILAGYVPNSLERRGPTLDRKRSEYFGFVRQYFELREQEQYADIFKQIQKDIPRMDTISAHKILQDRFERVLYIWSIRHPASGYVQGMNDLVTPFAFVFLQDYTPVDLDDLDGVGVSSLTEAQLDEVEADCFWCLTKLLDGIQDNYTFSQPGIQTKVNALKKLLERIDKELYEHLDANNVEFLQFAFRWMNNLLTRELPLRCVVRLWDTYLSEPDGFAVFHLYVCAGLLTHFSADLKREHDFQGLMLLLQKLPTHSWEDAELNEILANAFSLKELFANAPKHLVKRQPSTTLR